MRTQFRRRRRTVKSNVKDLKYVFMEEIRLTVKSVEDLKYVFTEDRNVKKWDLKYFMESKECGGSQICIHENKDGL